MNLPLASVLTLLYSPTNSGKLAFTPSAEENFTLLQHFPGLGGAAIFTISFYIYLESFNSL